MPNDMNLTLPTVSTTQGPTWANQINDALLTVSNHNHTPGNGALVPVAGLDINADLSFLGTSGAFSAVDLVSTRYANQSANPATERAIYSRGDNLYWNTTGGQEVQITNGTTVQAATGNITGMGPGITVSFSSPAYIFQQAVNTPAVLDAGTVRVRDLSVGSGSIDLTSPSPSANYTLTFPSTAPTAARLLGWSSSGLMNNVATDSTLSLSATTLGIASGGVVTASISNLAVTTAKIADGAVTAGKLSAVNTSQTTGSGNLTIAGTSTWNDVWVTPASLTITTLRPIVIVMQASPGGGSTAYVSSSAGTPEIQVTATLSGNTSIENCISISSAIRYAPGIVNCVFTPNGTGTWTFNVQVYQTSGSTTVRYCTLKVYQL